MKVNGQKIEEILADRGLKKKEFSGLCGISPQNISTVVKRGTCEPRTAGKLARGLGVPLADIIVQEVRV